MSLSTTAFLAGLFLASILVSLFYWSVVRECVIRMMTFRLFARRDKLRALAINGQEDYHSFAFERVEAFLCKTVSGAPSISLASFLLFYYNNRNVESPELQRTREEASPELNSILDATAKDALAVMAINSPFLMLFGALLLLAAMVHGAFEASCATIIAVAERYLGDLPTSKATVETNLQLA